MQKEHSTVCTTREAATLLGLSVTSVQKLAESGALASWKTKGGHRRLSMESVRAFQAAPGTSEQSLQPRTAAVRVLVVEDEILQSELYKTQFAAWGLELEVTFCRSGYEALIELGSGSYDVLVLDILMPGIDGYEVMETVMAKPALKDILTVVVSGISEEDLLARGGIPPGVTFLPKPVPMAELRGFLKACCAIRQRVGVRF